jgi:putative ABC transport system substrate-binding protein
MKRREFITLLDGSAGAAGVAAGWPGATRAQQLAGPVVGFLCMGSPASDARRIAPVLQGLKQTGYIEGQNLTIEYRDAEGQNDRLTALAADLAHLGLRDRCTQHHPRGDRGQGSNEHRSDCFCDWH